MASTPEDNQQNNQKADDTKVNYIKPSRPYLNISMLVGVLVFVAISATVLYRSFASVEVKFPTQPSRVLVELQDGHADGPIADSLKPAEVVNFRLYGNGLAVCGNSNIGQYTSQRLDKGALTAFMASFKNVGFDKIEDSLNNPNQTPPTIAASATLKVNFLNNYRQTTYSRNQIAKTSKANQDAKQIIDKFCSQTTQAYVSDKVIVRTKLSNKSTVTAKTRPSMLKKETFKKSGDKQVAATEVLDQEKTKQIINQLPLSQVQIVKDGNINYEIIADPILPEVDTSDQVVAGDPNKVQAAAQVPVQIIEFYPQGWAPGGDDLAKLTNMSNSAGHFYQYQIQGKTLNMLPARLVTGQKDLSYYLNYCGWVKQIDGCKRGSLDSILYGIYDTDGTALGVLGKSTIIYLPMQINDPAMCGTAFFPPRRFAVTDHEGARCSGVGDLNPENSNINHEMGHTFSLNHAPNEYPYDIMSAHPTIRCIYGPPSNCHLNDAYRAKLAASVYFQPDPIYTAGYSLVHRIYNGNNGKHLYSNNIAEINDDLRHG